MHTREINSTSGHRPGIHAVAAVGLMLCCIAVTSAEATNDNAGTNTAYIDSVESWGTWELGIEPAAGPQAVNAHAMTVRTANVQFRPNDNAAFRPNAERSSASMPVPGTPPAPIPTIPPGTAQSSLDSAPPTGNPRNR